jgi:hypothetical protein
MVLYLCAEPIAAIIPLMGAGFPGSGPQLHLIGRAVVKSW